MENCSSLFLLHSIFPKGAVSDLLVPISTVLLHGQAFMISVCRQAKLSDKNRSTFRCLSVTSLSR